MDTLQALSKVRIKGHVEDFNGQPMSNVNGVLTPSVLDKVKILNTLGQDPNSPEIQYELQRNLIYKGKVSIVNGYFDFSFVVPKDIALNYGLESLAITVTAMKLMRVDMIRVLSLVVLIQMEFQMRRDLR